MTSSTCPDHQTDGFGDEIIDDHNRYAAGPKPQRFDPSNERHRNMLHLIAYDIRDPKRLRHVAKTCEDYGLRVEYSVFECDLTEELFKNFWKRLQSLIDQEDDCILAYRICGGCVQRIQSMGMVVRPTPTLLYIA